MNSLWLICVSAYYLKWDWLYLRLQLCRYGQKSQQSNILYSRSVFKGRNTMLIISVNVSDCIVCRWYLTRVCDKSTVEEHSRPWRRQSGPAFRYYKVREPGKKMVSISNKASFLECTFSSWPLNLTTDWRTIKCFWFIVFLSTLLSHSPSAVIST